MCVGKAENRVISQKLEIRDYSKIILTVGLLIFINKPDPHIFFIL
jgi:hypothetical protein